MKHLAVVINWYGPYTTVEKASQTAKSDFGSGLYVIIGKLKHHQESKLQYIGLSKDLGSRITANHHKLSGITRELELWLGEVETSEPPGKKKKITSVTLDYAEWVHVFFLKFPLNDKKKANPPTQSVTVLNRWWGTDYKTLRVQRPYSDWPDLIDFISEDYPAKIVWFGGEQQRIPPFRPG